jgi:transcriptional regulator with XRE-family HTH domain
VTTIVHTENGFATELRRWRTARRLSQLELAQRAGTTQRHLSFIERGRSHPGRAIVVWLAESLGLSLRDRNALLLSAGYAPAFTEAALDEPALQPVRQALDRILDGWLLEPPGNVLRLALHPDLATNDGELRLMTTLTSFATATDITLADCAWKRSCPSTPRPPTSCARTESRATRAGQRYDSRCPLWPLAYGA